MKFFNVWFSEEETTEFIKKSAPYKNADFRLYKGEEDAGWVNFYFKYNESEFSVFTTLATSDLSDIVAFFENIIDLKEETAIFLDDEMVSIPLLYAAPVDNQKIRFLIADCERAHNLSKEGKMEDDYWNLCHYDIKCDVIVEKKKLLKEFYRAIKNVINTCETYEEHIYDINYNNWKGNLKNIIIYTRK